MSSLISSQSSCLPPASIEMMPFSSSSTNLHSRIEEIRRTCDTLRNQKPKYLSLYQFGFAISVIGTAVSIFLFSRELLACCVFIGGLFWKTIYRNNNRIQSIDELQRAQIDVQMILNYTILQQGNLTTCQSSLEKIRSKLNTPIVESNVMAGINLISQNLDLAVKDIKDFLNSYQRFEISDLRQQLDLLAYAIKILSTSDCREEVKERIEEFGDQLRMFDECISQLIRKFQETVVDLGESVKLKTELMNRWFI